MPDGDAGKPFCVNRFYYTTRLERVAKNFETALPKNLSEIDKLDPKTAIRFIATIAMNGFAVSESVKRYLDLDVAGRLLFDQSKPARSLGSVVGKTH